jgi:hypothetical protein
LKDEYDIGYGKPPKETRFNRGKSGNKRGRAKGRKNTYTLLNEILGQKITVEANGGQFRISKKMAMLTQLVNKGVNGDIKAISTLLPHILMADIKEEDKEKLLAALNSEDKAILKMYISQFDGGKKVDDKTGK